MSPIPFDELRLDRAEERRQDEISEARAASRPLDFAGEIRQAVRHCNPTQLVTWNGRLASLDNMLADHFVGSALDLATFLALTMRAARTDEGLRAWWESYAQQHDAREFGRLG